MAYRYNHFISQNVAPKGAKNIVVYDSDGKKVMSFPLGGLTPPSGNKLYSFGLISDVHILNGATNWEAEKKLPKALQYFEEQGCSFCVHCGDLVNYGFFHKNDTTGEIWLDNDFAKYDAIRKNFSIPIYGLCGNHESYGKNIVDTTPITINGVTKTMLEFLYDYTTEAEGTSGKAKLSYTIQHGNDLFVFLGQPKQNVPLCGENGEENINWITNVLEANKNKRCFVFFHSHLNNDSGNPLNGTSIFNGWTYETAFKNLLKSYPNVVVFHGHTHMAFESQEYDLKSNFTEINGFKSVHVPSLSRVKYVDTGLSTTESQGYIVDVYSDCIVLNGMDFINNKPVPLGTLKIDIAEGY